MHIEVLLPNPYTVSIIHDELIYGDTFIEPTDLGKNIKATYLSNLGEISLEYCIKTILEENPNATFHTIQYSKKRKTICFYADTYLNIEKWHEKEVKQPQTLFGKEDIVNAVLSVFDNEYIYDQDCASIYEILMIYRNLEKQIKSVHKQIEKIIKNKFQTYIEKDIYCCVHDYEYNKRILPIHCSSRFSSTWDKYNYSKEPNGTIKETKIEGYNTYNILGNISKEIEELIDFYLSIEETRTQEKRRIKAVNSNLFIDIDQYNIDVYVIRNDSYYNYHFSNPVYKSTFYTYKEEPEHSYPYSDILERLTGNEMDFLQKIYVKIDDCPLWIREQLYSKRQEEIRERRKQQEEELLKQKEQEIIEEETSINKEAPQKKLSLFQKIFPRKKENI